MACINLDAELRKVRDSVRRDGLLAQDKPAFTQQRSDRDMRQLTINSAECQEQK